MITKLSHVTLFVKDQDEALKFYTEKLGFEVRVDTVMEGFRWVTVGPPEQKESDLVLMAVAPSPMYDQETLDALNLLLEKGALGAGVFQTDDCHATCARLKERGVEFVQEPTERPYGVEAVFRDNSGNWFSLNQPMSYGAGS